MSRPQQRFLRNARRVAGRFQRGLSQRISRPQAAQPRIDPVPPTQSFPQARYILLLNGIPERPGGGALSGLKKQRFFSEIAGVDMEIVSLEYAAWRSRVAAKHREYGNAAPDGRISNLYDVLIGDAETEPDEVKTYPIKVAGLDEIKDPDHTWYRYFDNGVYRMFRNYFSDGTLMLEDHFLPNRCRSRRDHFDEWGRIMARTYYDLHHNLPRQEVYYRPDGTAYLNKWLVVESGSEKGAATREGTATKDAVAVKNGVVAKDGVVAKVSRVERVTLLDEQERPYRVFSSEKDFEHYCLDQLIGDAETFLFVEAHKTFSSLLDYKRPNVKRIFVLHSGHVELPGADLRNVRPRFQELLRRHCEVDAVVFHTAAQRADAEAVCGQQDNFYVIPHAITPPDMDSQIVRDLQVACDPGLAVRDSESVTRDPKLVARDPKSATRDPKLVARDPKSATRDLELIACDSGLATRDPKLVVMVARLVADKQLDHAISAFAQVVKAVPDARLEIYGHEEETKAKLEKLIVKHSLQKAVRLAGYAPDPAAVFQRAAFSLLTSRFEGFGLVVLESLANGCPVISYDIRYGPSDMIRDGQTGYLIVPNNVNLLAAKTIELLQNPALREKMSQEAPEVIVRFSPQSQIARYAGLCNDLL